MDIVWPSIDCTGRTDSLTCVREREKEKRGEGEREGREELNLR